MSIPWALIILTAISSIPVVIVYTWFRLAKYEFSTIWFLFALLAGAAAFFPALILQNLLNFSFASNKVFYHVFVRIAFAEEFSRLLLLLVFFLLNKFLNNQTVSYADVKKASAAGLIAGLGFAILETTLYAASNSNVLLLRTITAAPLHAACGSRIGAAAKLLPSNPVQAIFRILTATAIHGIYNLMISIPGITSLAAVLIAFTALGSSIITIRGGWTIDIFAESEHNQDHDAR